jgi:hypothetical protein
VSSLAPARRRRQAAVRQAGLQNRWGEPGWGLANSPLMAVTVKCPQQAQTNPCRDGGRAGAGEASRITGRARLVGRRRVGGRAGRCVWWRGQGVAAGGRGGVAGQVDDHLLGIGATGPVTSLATGTVT